MTRNYGLSRRPDSVGAYGNPAGSHTRVLVRELDSLPPLPSGAIFKPSDIDQPPSYKFSAFEGFLISLVTFAAVVIAGAVLLFVES